MTTMSLNTAAEATSTAADPESRLRQVLAVNAITSGVAGVAGLAAADWWAETLGITSVGWVQLISAGLVLFALEVIWVAARASRSLRPAALAVSVADAAWIVGTAVVLATVDLTTTGWVLAVAMGVGVADFAILQLWFRRRLS